MSSKLHFMRSSRGRNWLFYNGFCFRKDSSGVKKQSWRCVKCSKYKCYARVHTQQGKIVRQIGQHTHAAEPLSAFGDPSLWYESNALEESTALEESPALEDTSMESTILPI